MEDDKTPANPRKRATEAKPNAPSPTDDHPTGNASAPAKKAAPAKKVPPATFVAPAPTAPAARPAAKKTTPAQRPQPSQNAESGPGSPAKNNGPAAKSTGPAPKSTAPPAKSTGPAPKSATTGAPAKPADTAPATPPAPKAAPAKKATAPRKATKAVPAQPTPPTRIEATAPVEPTPNVTPAPGTTPTAGTTPTPSDTATTTEPPPGTKPAPSTPDTAPNRPATTADAIIKKTAKKAAAKKAQAKRTSSSTEPTTGSPLAKTAKKTAARKTAPPKTTPPPDVQADLPLPTTPAPEAELPKAELPTAQPATVETAPVPYTPPLPVKPAQTWAKIKTNPGYAAELLAITAVERLGPAAGARIAGLRDTYPSATPDGLARLTLVNHTRLARTRGAVAGLVGPLAVLVETAAVVWAEAQLVLELAAAYGRDPADQARAAELLVLLRVHPDLATARAAVTAADDRGDPTRLASPLSRLAGRGLLRRSLALRASRLVPGGGAVITAITSARATERLAARATRFYKTLPRSW